MSLPIAIQSVVFYVLSCSTCNKITHRRKARIKAEKDRQEKHELETEQPGLYRHPSPFQTNPYWTEEIMMGPGIPVKKGGKNECKNGSQRALNTAGMGSSVASSGGISTEPGSSPTAVGGSRISGEGWNWKRYQREDEDLWGHDLHWPKQKIKNVLSTAGRMLEDRLSRISPSDEPSGEEEQASYFIKKNPPVNDLHPPIVSHTTKKDAAWMLQPPPDSAIMEGKMPVKPSRSRAQSNTSTQKGTNSPGLKVSRPGSNLQPVETPTLPKLQTGSSRPVSRPEKLGSSFPIAKPYQRRGSFSSSDDEVVTRKKRRPQSIAISAVQRSSGETVEHIAIPAEGYSSEMSPALSNIVKPSKVVLKDSVTLPLRASSNDSKNSKAPSPSKGSPTSTTIPVTESMFPGTKPFVFPSRSMQNERP